MKKTLLSYFPALCALALACSGESPYDGDDQADGLKLGSAEQPMVAKNSPNFQMGSQTGGKHNRCTTTSTGQVCQVPTTKNIHWSVSNLDFTTIPDATGYTREVFNGSANTQGFKPQLAAVGAGWTFTEETANPPAHQVNIAILAANDVCGSSGSASSDINNYSCVTWSAPTSMTEGAGVKGNYQNSILCTVFVDMTALAIKANGNSTVLGFLARHAISHGAAACMGMGNRTDAPVPIATRQDMNVGVERSALTVGELCVLASFNQTATPGSFSLSTPACTND